MIQNISTGKPVTVSTTVILEPREVPSMGAGLVTLKPREVPVLGSGVRKASLWTGEGPPHLVIGAAIGDEYLDSITGIMYRLDPGE